MKYEYSMVSAGKRRTLFPYNSPTTFVSAFIRVHSITNAALTAPDTESSPTVSKKANKHTFMSGNLRVSEGGECTVPHTPPPPHHRNKTTDNLLLSSGRPDGSGPGVS